MDTAAFKNELKFRLRARVLANNGPSLQKRFHDHKDKKR